MRRRPQTPAVSPRHVGAAFLAITAVIDRSTATDNFPHSRYFRFAAPGETPIPSLTPDSASYDTTCGNIDERGGVAGYTLTCGSGSLTID